MKKRTNIGNAIGFYARKNSISQGKLAEISGLAQPTISTLISGHSRINIDSLKAICNCWPKPEMNLLILIEHLRDEIGRAGHDPNSDIEMRPVRPHSLPRTAALQDLAYLEANLDHEGVIEGIRLLASLVRRADSATNHHAAQPHEPMVAERPEKHNTYRTSTEKPT